VSEGTGIDKVECTVIEESPKAFKLQDKANPERLDWFPKSQISFDRRNINTGDALAVIPLWLLKSKGWDS
jgi:hypothetical protein